MHVARRVFALDGDDKVKKIFSDADAAHVKSIKFSAARPREPLLSEDHHLRTLDGTVAFAIPPKSLQSNG